MSEHRTRGRGADRLIAEYGAFLGIPGLAFDEDGEITLEIGDQLVGVQAGDDETGFVVKAVIEPNDAIPDDMMAAFVAIHNVEAMLNGMGIVALDAGNAAWVWLDRFDPAGLDAARLHQRLARVERDVAYWQSLIDRLPAGAGEPAAADEPMPADMHFIRP